MKTKQLKAHVGSYVRVIAQRGSNLRVGTTGKIAEISLDEAFVVTADYGPRAAAWVPLRNLHVIPRSQT